MPDFNPAQFGATPVTTTDSSGSSFDPSQFGATPVNSNSTDASVLDPSQTPSYQNTTSVQGNPVTNLGGSFWNTLSSVGRVLFGNDQGQVTADSLFNPVSAVKHVGHVAKTLAQVAVGGGEDLAAHITGTTSKLPTTPDTSFFGGAYGTFENMVNSFGDGALKGGQTKSVGGGLKAALIKANNDPAGFLMDMSVFLDAGGGALKAAGGSSEAIDAVTTAAGNAAKAGDFETAAQILQKAKELGIESANTAGKVGEGMQTVGDAINPIAGPVKAAGKAITKVGGMIQAPFSGAVNTPFQQAMQEIGLDPNKAPLSANTNSKFLQQADALGAHGFGENFGGLGGKGIVQSLNDTTSQVNDFIKNTVQTMTPDTVALSPHGLGGLITTGQQTLADLEESSMKGTYNEFSKANGEAPVVTTNTIPTIQKYLQIEENAPASVRNNAVIKQYQAMLTDLTGQNSTLPKFGAAADGSGFSPNADGVAQIKAKLAAMGVDTEGGMTFAELQKMRTNFMQMIKNGGSEIATGDQAQFQGISTAMKADMNATVTAVDPALGKQLSDMQDTYRTTLGKFNSKVSSVIKNPNTPPEAIVKSLFDPTKPSQIQNLMDTQPPDVIAEVRAAFLEKLINDSTDKKGNFNIDSFKANQAKYDPNVLDSMFTPEQKARLDQATQKLETAKIAQQGLRQAAEQINGGSRTTFNTLTLRTLQGVAALGPQIFGFLTGNHQLSIASIMQGLGGDTVTGVATQIGMGQLLNSAWGKKWLTNGFDTNIGKMVQTYAPELGDMGKISNAYEQSNGQSTSSPASAMPDVPFQYPPQQ